MSHVYFISDLHFGHESITKFCPEKRYGDDWRENMHCIIENWNGLVTKRDTVFVLGDAAFGQEGFDALKELRGRKFLVRGNHDTFSTRQYLEVFAEVYGFMSYKGYWLSHCPMHHSELRGRLGNIHGHLHNLVVRNQYSMEPDRSYINVCVEWANHLPVRFSDIISGEYQKVQHEIL